MSLILDEFNTKVVIELENGIYRFTNQSSTGKSYLYNVLSIYLKGKIPVFAINYIDFLKGITLDTAFKNNARLILLDRYDMYKGAFDKEINELSKQAAVLLDCKSPTPLEARYCIIKLLNSNHIVVR